jgi:hypothetical protein
MTKIALFLFIFAGIFAFLAIAELLRTKRIQRVIENDLADKAEYLAGVKKRLDDYQQDLINKEASLNMDAATPIRATYFVSESDALKYTDEKKLERAVKKSLCNSLADSIMKIAEPRKGTADGRDFYMLRFRVKEEL